MPIRKGLPHGPKPDDYRVMGRIKKIRQIWKNDKCRILDVGCGYGAYTLALSENAALAIGLDLEWEFIKRASNENSGSNVEYALASGAFLLPFKNEIFNAVFLIETLEHVESEEKILKEAYRVLFNGGEIVITVPNKYFPLETHSIDFYSRRIEPPIPAFSWLPQRIRSKHETARVYTLRDLIKKLRGVGFYIKCCTYIPPLWLSRIRRFIEWVFQKPLLKYFCPTILVFAEKGKSEI